MALLQLRLTRLEVAVGGGDQVSNGVGGLGGLGRGSWRVEAAPLAVKRGLDVFGEPGERLGLLRRLKAEYDPDGVLNPGRFAGRL